MLQELFILPIILKSARMVMNPHPRMKVLKYFKVGRGIQMIILKLEIMKYLELPIKTRDSIKEWIKVQI